MIHRLVTSEIEDALRRQAVVALIGPRQVGKTTLALQIGEALNAVYPSRRKTHSFRGGI